MPAPPRALQFVADTLSTLCVTTLIAILLSLIILLGVLATCSPLRTLNTLLSSSGHRITTGLAYDDSERQRFDLDVPRELMAPAPVVVFFHGGSCNSVRGGIGLAARYDFLPIRNPDVQLVFTHPDTPDRFTYLASARTRADSQYDCAARRGERISADG